MQRVYSACGSVIIFRFNSAALTPAGFYFPNLQGWHLPVSAAGSLHGCGASSRRWRRPSPGCKPACCWRCWPIFLLLAANFQSFRLAVAILFTVPAVLCGVILMLLATGTTLNIQSFMGAIMAIGIAVANSILLLTFAERFRHEGQSVFEAAREGAASRLRAVLMTAAAMIGGMLPMALGITEGGSQAAPLGRAVIGGLIAGTFTTLTVLPSLYAILQGRASVESPSLNPMDPSSRYYEAS